MGRKEAQAKSLQSLRSDVVALVGERETVEIEQEVRECMYDKEGRKYSTGIALYFWRGIRIQRDLIRQYGDLLISSEKEAV